MKVLVSGATGFMGSSITRHLLADGHHVRALTRSEERARSRLGRFPAGRKALDEGRLTFVSADVTVPDTLPDAVRDVDAVIQAAQFPGAPVEDPSKGYTYMNVDRNGTLNLLSAVADVYGARTAGPGLIRYPEGAPWFLYLSGVTVSEDAPESWNKAKWQAEEAITGSGLTWTIVRASWSYGPEDQALNRLLGYSDYSPFVPTFGDGTEEVTPLFVEDLGRFFALLLTDPAAAHDTVFQLGGPEVLTMNQVLRTALRVMGRRRWILHIPKTIGRAQGALLQLLPQRPLTPAAVDFASQGGVADLTAVRTRFPDFGPTPLRTGLATYLGR